MWLVEKYMEREKMRQRTVTVHRLIHTYKEWDIKGVNNMLEDNRPVHIYLDNRDCGALVKGGSLTIGMDNRCHTLKHAPLGVKSAIPSGTDDYEAYYFNHSLSIGPVRDPFRDELTKSVVHMFRGQEIKERVSNPNNQYRSIQIKISSEAIRLSWCLSKTKGIKQWMTGEKEEKIFYYQMGLVPLAKEKQPDGYWDYVQLWIEHAIESDEKVNMERGMGGFTIKKS